MLTQNPHIWPIIVFAIETGMRRSEILGLTWDNISLERQLAYLPIDQEWNKQRGSFIDKSSGCPERSVVTS